MSTFNWRRGSGFEVTAQVDTLRQTSCSANFKDTGYRIQDSGNRSETHLILHPVSCIIQGFYRGPDRRTDKHMNTEGVIAQIARIK